MNRKRASLPSRAIRSFVSRPSNTVVNGGLVRGAYLGLGFLVTAIFARILGPAEFGEYAFFVTVATTLSIIANAGLTMLVTREASEIRICENWSELSSLVAWSNKLIAVIAFSLILSIISLELLGSVEDPDSKFGLRVAACAFPLIAYTSLRIGLIRGSGRVVASMVPDHIVRPLTLLVCAIALAGASNYLPVDSRFALGAFLLAVSLGLLSSILLVKRIPYKTAGSRSAHSKKKNRYWLKALVFMSVNAGMNQILSSSDIILLGILVQESEVGLYRIAQQLAILGIFGVQVVAMTASPRIKPLLIQSRHPELKALMTTCARQASAVAVAVLLVYVFFGPFLLRAFFGSSFVESHDVLSVLALAAVVQAAFGIPGTLLTMSGNERVVAGALSLAAALNLALNALLIPSYGMLGSAWATLIATAIWNSCLFYKARERLGISTFIL